MTQSHRDTIYVDLDGTLCPVKKEEERYEDLPVRTDLLARLQQARERGFRIVVHTARNMRTYAGDLSHINRHTAPLILAWLDKHSVPYDGLLVGKPWPGPRGFYVDDRTVRPDEFVETDLEKISQLLGQDQ